jgi:hypothetical protein
MWKTIAPAWLSAVAAIVACAISFMALMGIDRANTNINQLNQMTGQILMTHAGGGGGGGGLNGGTGGGGGGGPGGPNGPGGAGAPGGAITNPQSPPARR